MTIQNTDTSGVWKLREVKEGGREAGDILR
jgi:hypothetical protein